MKKCSDACISCHPDKELEKVIKKLNKHDAMILLTRLTVPVQHKIVDVYDKLEDTKLKKTLNEVDFATSTFIEYLQLQTFSENKRKPVFYTSKVGRK